MRILVAGANGKTGKQIVELLLEDEHDVMAMVRKPEQMEEMEKMGAKPILSDLEQDVDFAVEGAEAVIFAAGSGPHTGPDKTLAVDRDGAIKLIGACEKNAVERFVMLSSIGVDRPEEKPEKLRPYLEAKKAADDRLKKSSLNYTIVRPGSLTNDSESGTISAGKSLDNSTGQISRADVARTIALAINNPNTYRKVIEVVGGDQPVEEALKQI